MSLSYRTHNNLLRIIIINSFSSLILSFYNQTYMLEKLPWRQLSMTVTHFFYQEVSLKPLMQECNITNSLSRSLKFLQKNLSEIILMQTSCHKNKRMIDYIFFANRKSSILLWVWPWTTTPTLRSKKDQINNAGSRVISQAVFIQIVIKRINHLQWKQPRLMCQANRIISSYLLRLYLQILCWGIVMLTILCWKKVETLRSQGLNTRLWARMIR